MLTSLCSLSFLPGTPELAVAQWVQAEGGFLGAVTAERRHDRRGLYASKDVAAGEVLMAIPQKCCIYAETDSQFGLSLHELGVSRLLGALSRDDASAYLASLPEEEPLLCDWSGAELAELQSSYIENEAGGQSEYVARLVKRIRPWLSDALDVETIRWAERMVRSRALRFNPGWDGTPTLSMVPLIDLANHQTPLRAEATDTYVEPVCMVGSPSGSDGWVVLRAASALSCGSEVCITYRREGNGALLLDYGFAEAPCAGRPTGERLVLELGDELGDGGEQVQLGSDELDELAVGALRGWHGDLSGEELDRATCETLRGACEAKLRRMPTTEEADREALVHLTGATATSGVRRAAALAFRISQKVQLQRTVDELTALQETGSTPRTTALLDALRRAHC